MRSLLCRCDPTFVSKLYSFCILPGKLLIGDAQIIALCLASTHPSKEETQGVLVINFSFPNLPNAAASAFTKHAVLSDISPFECIPYIQGDFLSRVFPRQKFSIDQKASSGETQPAPTRSPVQSVWQAYKARTRYTLDGAQLRRVQWIRPFDHRLPGWWQR